jgi:DNA replication protein DnaC
MGVREEIARRQSSGLNKLVQKNTFKTYQAKEPWQREIAKRACDYVRSPEGWFFIGGQVGCGKTHICTAIVNALMSKGRAARYMVWNEVVTGLKQAATDARVYEALLKNQQRAGILYIDDFFKVAKGFSVTASDINTTFKIINYRYNENLPTIISSELSIAEIIELDEALGSRIAEMTKGNDLYVAKDSKKNYRYRRS